MTILLITGAGASRNLGKHGIPMPLMPDWSDALCADLDRQEPNLASACRLYPGMNGEEFEKNLGLLLRWEQVRHLSERFELLGGSSAGERMTGVRREREHVKKRMQVVMNTLNRSLFEQFGQARVDDVRAVAVYGALLSQMGEPDLIYATTNYDRIGETALETMEYDVDTGFHSTPHRTPTLQPTGIVSERGSRVPSLHLHGAVGWYEQDGEVSNFPADREFNGTLGTPVVLYPDPDKDPTSDAIVSEIWHEFDAALEAADAVLVIGHSLHDPPLVQKLRGVVKVKPVVISVFDPSEAARIERLVPGARATDLDFSPEMVIEKGALSFLSPAPLVRRS